MKVVNIISSKTVDPSLIRVLNYCSLRSLSKRDKLATAANYWN